MIREDKSVAVIKSATASDLEAINRFSRKELTADDVYTFRVRLCDDIVDRDCECFSVDALKELGELFVGKPFLFDHVWSATKQTARIYSTHLEKDGDATCLMADVYMLRLPGNGDLIAMIDGGILKEISVGCAMGTSTCGICGESYSKCDHYRGRVYSGTTCHVILSDAQDAYEASFVAVPAQPAAGVQKSTTEKQYMSITEVESAKQQLALEKLRFGG